MILLIVICYLYADKNMVAYFHSINTRRYQWMDTVQQLPALLLILSPVLIIAAYILTKNNNNKQLKEFLVSSSLSILLANILKFPLKYVFSRYWPETFVNNNPSFLRDGSYGFHPFHWGVSYSSFPSGHAITITAFATCIWMIYPRLRWIAVTLTLSVLLALLLLYYHFLSDLLAGSYIGIMLSIFLNNYLRKKYAYFC